MAISEEDELDRLRNDNLYEIQQRTKVERLIKKDDYKPGDIVTWRFGTSNGIRYQWHSAIRQESGRWTTTDGANLSWISLLEAIVRPGLSDVQAYRIPTEGALND